MFKSGSRPLSRNLLSLPLPSIRLAAAVAAAAPFGAFDTSCCEYYTGQRLQSLASKLEQQIDARDVQASIGTSRMAAIVHGIPDVPAPRSAPSVVIAGAERGVGRQTLLVVKQTWTQTDHLSCREIDTRLGCSHNHYLMRAKLAIGHQMQF